jgi:hypothetical protein
LLHLNRSFFLVSNSCSCCHEVQAVHKQGELRGS